MNDNKKAILVVAWLCKEHEKLASDYITQGDGRKQKAPYVKEGYEQSELCAVQGCTNYANSLCLLNVIK
ncbi:MAG: hypothetical protein QW478_15490 [Candidatus Micrarchaeaceae archaeon]